MHDQRSTLWGVWERRLPVAALARGVEPFVRSWM